LLYFAGLPQGRPDETPTLSADTGWDRIEQKDGVAVYSRTRIGSAMREFKGSGLIEAPAQEIEKLLRDVQNYTAFMPYVAEARILSRTASQVVAYQRLELPFVSQRDYTLRVDHGTTTNANGATAYLDTWQAANELGPAERHGVVRVKVDDGSWLLEPAGPTGSSTLATYQVYTDAGGVIPAFLANHASESIIPKLFEAIRKQVHATKSQN